MVKTHTLSNGVRIVSDPMPFTRSVSIGIWIHVGSRHEPSHLSGMAHFVEHMLFKGTASRSARDIAEQFDRIGGQINAFTTKEYTCLHAKVIDTHANQALEILADMFFHSQFLTADIEKEKQIIYEEIKMYEDTPDELVHDLLMEAAYPEQAFGRSILGSEQTVSTFTAKTVSEFQRNTYQPQRVVISVAGHYSPEFITEIGESFSSFPSMESDICLHEEAIFTPKQINRQKETEQTHVCFGFEAVSSQSEAIYPLAIVNNLLGGSMSSRLFQHIREDRGLAYSVYSYFSTYEDQGLFTIYAGVANDQLDELKEAIEYNVRQLVLHGITLDELAAQKEQLKGHILLSSEGTDSRMEQNGKNELLLGQPQTVESFISRLEAVTFDELHRFVEQCLTKEPAIAIVSP
ncbi:insulinase family protein [Bacillaceae bacterium SIJ1]|uniref:M16 family metallopeptidase n=1 Tax=Litoribacterium kuwaitense TaxID=1398745 RepID=UPI0013EE0A52|nr:pitrilysin family protein [Litoribacterium kuwaitense]NGP44082.1 insulinase family protein [Litoribacterium kuwaitense]